ncbi:MAG TPA: IS1595 family transposase [Candidatus Binataceae bacterium]|nr:IS1595 family transposase [Candidatus Binataceae bacterium]
MTGPKVDLRSPKFHDDDAAREHVESVLWPDGPVCPRCGVMGDRITKLQGKSTRPGVYKCKDCRKPFTVTVGTVMERSHIPLSKWVLAAQFMASSKKSMSALQLQRMLDTNYETAWFLFHRLREAANDLDGSGPLGGQNKVVEADETYIGGKEANKHKSKRAHAGRGPVGKQAVFSLVERDGYVRSRHVADVTAKTLGNAIVTQADRKSYLMTDEAAVYTKLGEEFAGHGTVNHSAEEYVRGTFWHTNTVEGFFALLKRAVYGQFHNVSEAHLHRYLAEADFKYNTRSMADVERAAELLRGAKGKRLLYRQPNEAPHA